MGRHAEQHTPSNVRGAREVSRCRSFRNNLIQMFNLVFQVLRGPFELFEEYRRIT